MARLIDADELVAELIYLYEDRGWHEREIHFSLTDMRCNVDIIPTVDPVKHGHWKMNPQYGAECSECGLAMFEIVGVPYTNFKPNYCPDCGAKMDEVEDD